MGYLAKKILLVEDDIMFGEAIKDTLTKRGFNVILGRNGLEGLELAQKQKPDLIITDLLMPAMDGMSMLKEIRKNPEINKIPCIALTNLNDTQTIQTCLENGVYDYFVKSDCSPADLTERIKDKLAKGF
jgi:DNA-binding response OmpR family regulator